MSSPVLDAYADFVLAQDALRKAMDEHLHEVDDSELVRLLRAHDRAEARHDALGLDLVGEAAARDLPHRHGATSPGTWLAGLLTMHPHTAAERVRTALALELHCPATYDRLASGDIPSSGPPR